MYAPRWSCHFSSLTFEVETCKVLMLFAKSPAGVNRNKTGIVLISENDVYRL